MAYLLAEWSGPIALGVIFISRSRLTVLVSYVVGILCFQYLDGRMFFLPEVLGSSIRASLYTTLSALISDWVFGLGVVALVWGSLRGNNASRFLFLLATIQVVAMALGFGGPEHILVAQVFVVLGVAAVETGPALLVLSLVLLGVRLPAVSDGTDGHREMVSVIRATSSSHEKSLCTSSEFVRPALSNGWIRPCFSLDRIPRAPEEIYPLHVRQAANELQARLFVVEESAILHTYPWLQEFLEAPYPDGFRLVEKSGEWKVFSINP